MKTNESGIYVIGGKKKRLTTYNSVAYEMDSIKSKIADAKHEIDSILALIERHENDLETLKNVLKTL